MNRNVALLLALAVVLGGCTDAPGPASEPAPSETPGPAAVNETAGPTPRAEIEAATDNDTAAPPAPWTLQGVDCATDFFAFPGEREGTMRHVPASLQTTGGTPTVLITILAHHCDALVERNTSLAKDVNLVTVFVTANSDDELPRFLLEVLTDWPDLAATLAATGTPTHVVDVQRSDGALDLVGDGVSYRFLGQESSVPNPSTPITYAMYAGLDGEYLLHYEYLLQESTDAPGAMTLQVEGGVLADAVPTGAVAAQHGFDQANLRISDSNKGVHLPQ